MARRVFVHIGTMKSATTYVQELCDRNRRVLREAGVLWTSAEANLKAVDQLLGIHRDRPGLDAAWEELNAAIRGHDDTALISNELLAPVHEPKIEHLVEALSPAEVHVVITARDLARVVPSQWQEGVRNGQTVAWGDFVAGIRGDEGADKEIGRTFWRKHGVAGVVARWSTYVALDRITVVTVPPSGSPAALVGERFASVLGVDPATLEQPRSRNPSLGGHSAELLRRVNERCGSFGLLDYKWAFKHALARFTLAERAGQEPALVLNADQQDWARSRAQAMIEAIRGSGVPVVGDLDDLLPALSGANGAVDPTRATDAEMLDVALDGLVGMGRMLANLRMEYDGLLRDLEAKLPPSRPGDRQTFAASLDRPEVKHPGIPTKGRFLRWRLANTESTFTGTPTERRRRWRGHAAGW